MGFKMGLYICNKKGLIETHIYKPNGSVIVEPANPVEIVIAEDSD